MGDHAEQMQGVGMAGIGRENAPIKSIGLGQPPGLMMPDGLRELLLKDRISPR
jgi:hypothetical protein